MSKRTCANCGVTMTFWHPGNTCSVECTLARRRASYDGMGMELVGGKPLTEADLQRITDFAEGGNEFRDNVWNPKPALDPYTEYEVVELDALPEPMFRPDENSEFSRLERATYQALDAPPLRWWQFWRWFT